MPIYEYECRNCGKQCEVIQKFSDEPLHNCPDCGGPLHKLISHTSFILKGTGWYATDYAHPERKKSSGTFAEPVAKAENKTKSKPKAEVAAKH